MDEEKEGEDASIITLRQFVTVRMDEIQALTAKIEQVGEAGKFGQEPRNSNANVGLVFQHVPKHMRRRAVSHNPKRLPRRLREGHIAQVLKSKKDMSKQVEKLQDVDADSDSDQDEYAYGQKDSDGKKKSPKCRKFRRRPSNLLWEYNRRQMKVKWLETHIWHAKRFHLVNKWNYRIPLRPCEKGFRALYRASAKGITMRDISFHSCLEICGSMSIICDKFKEIAVPATNQLSLGAVFYTTGEREGELHLYKKGKYPHEYIGNVKFIWKPDLTALWLWVHPAFKTEILQEILSIFELTQIDLSHVSLTTVPTRDEVKLKPRNLHILPTWVNSEVGIKMTDLGGALNRIRICGPGSLQGLQNILRVKSSFTSTEDDERNARQRGGYHIPHWQEEFYEGKNQIVETQAKFWNFQFSQGLPCNSVIPLTVRDPRIFLPKRRKRLASMMELDGEDGGERQGYEQDMIRTPNEVHWEDIELLEEYWKISANSPIWDTVVREKLILQKMSDGELSQRRGKMLIPGSELDLGFDENQIPILLIDQPDIGIDLIIPAGWAMPFWIAFVYRCIRPYGLRESLHFAYEKCSFNYHDLLPPDCPAGKEEREVQNKINEETYFKRHPDKRENLIKLCCPVPFGVDWSLLTSEWQPAGPQPFTFTCPFILRDIKLIEQLQRILKSKKKNLELTQDFPHPNYCLVGVRVIIHQRGQPSIGSLICIPAEEDLVKLDTSRTFDYNEPRGVNNGVKEKKKKLRNEHRKYLAFLRKKRKKNRGKETEEVYDSTKVVQNYNIQMRELCLPDNEMIFKSMTRATMGFLTAGGECYSIGKCAYMGYVSILALVEYIRRAKNKKNFVLLRDSRSTLSYRVGRIEVVSMNF